MDDKYIMPLKVRIKVDLISIKTGNVIYPHIFKPFDFSDEILLEN